jgi:hypothetical protein
MNKRLYEYYDLEENPNIILFKLSGQFQYVDSVIRKIGELSNGTLGVGNLQHTTLQKDGIEVDSHYSSYYQQDPNWKMYIDIYVDKKKFDKEDIRSFREEFNILKYDLKYNGQEALGIYENKNINMLKETEDENTYYVLDTFNHKRYGYYDGLSKNEANALKRRIAQNKNVGIENLSVKKIPLDEGFYDDATYREEGMWTRDEVNDFVNDLKSEGGIGDDEAFDIAEGILADEPGLKKYIIKMMGIKDPIGWLANRIV